MFTGHRNVPPLLAEELTQRLISEIRRAYGEGFRIFYNGGAVGFDALAAKTLLDLQKTELPDAKLILALPFFGHFRKWSKEDQIGYAEILSAADKVVYVWQNNSRDSYLERNRYMADRSALCLCYCTEKTGGTAYTVAYAKKHGLRIVDLTRSF